MSVCISEVDSRTFRSSELETDDESDSLEERSYSKRSIVGPAKKGFEILFCRFPRAMSVALSHQLFEGASD